MTTFRVSDAADDPSEVDGDAQLQSSHLPCVDVAKVTADGTALPPVPDHFDGLRRVAATGEVPLSRRR